MTVNEVLPDFPNVYITEPLASVDPARHLVRVPHRNLDQGNLVKDFPILQALDDGSRHTCGSMWTLNSTLSCLEK